jgi:sec-independent protein translocase protein TatA
MFGLGGMEMVIFLVIVILIFGSRLPTAMFSVGKSINEFKKGLNEKEETTNLPNDQNKV